MSELLEKLSIQDKEKINTYIDNCCDADSVNHNRDVDYILRFWNSQKRYLYDTIFKTSFILSKKIEYDVPYEDILYEITNDELLSAFTTKICAFAAERHNYLTSESKMQIPCYNREWTYFNIFGCHSMTSNKISTITAFHTNNIVWVDENGKTLCLHNGEKYFKFIKKFLKFFNLEDQINLSEAENRFSLHFNQKRLSGNLNLSIHPLDYMTMSDNDNGWSSCMSWAERGEYRQGTVEMMNSRSVIVAYLSSEREKASLEGIAWNNKKWRCLFICDDDVITSVKCYPYYNRELILNCLDWIKDLHPNKENLKYYEEFSDNPCFETNNMYNDFGTTTHHSFFKEKKEDVEVYNYSGVAECMNCGEVLSYDMDNVERLCCDKCQCEYHCCSCECEYTGEPYAVDPDGNYWCEECYYDAAAARDAFSWDHDYIWRDYEHEYNINIFTYGGEIRKFVFYSQIDINDYFTLHNTLYFDKNCNITDNPTNNYLTLDEELNEFVASKGLSKLLADYAY